MFFLYQSLEAEAESVLTDVKAANVTHAEWLGVGVAK